MKEVFVIGGPNGAGKTTTAMNLLPRHLHMAEFVNADELPAEFHLSILTELLLQPAGSCSNASASSPKLKKALRSKPPVLAGVIFAHCKCAAVPDTF